MTELDGRTRARRTRALLGALLASTIIAGSGFAWSEAGAAPEATTAPLALAPVVNQAGFADLVAKVTPAVVTIATTEGAQQTADQDTPNLQEEMPSVPQGSPFGDMLHQFMNQQGQQGQPDASPVHALGSGFIIDPAGYIVTNNHVVDGAHKITVTTTDGQTYPAKVIGHDAKTDLALIKIEAAKPLPYVAFGNSDKERIGDWVVAVGNPYGLGGTVTAGIVSAHDRDLDNGPYDDYLQIDAPINPGNSGGPLFDQSGQVIGIDTAIYSPNGGSVGIGFAIPSNLATKVVAQLREHGKVDRGWLGIAMQPVTPALAKAIGRSDTSGVLVDSVTADSPAAQAKLQQGDVITAFNGQAITNPRDLATDVANTASGTTAKMSIWRDGHAQAVDVAIANQPEAQTASNEGVSNDSPVGMALARLTPDQRGTLGLNPSVQGVVVAQVSPDSRADESGVQSGDVIVKVGDQAVTTPAEAASQIKAAESAKKEAIPLLVMRDGTTYYLALKLA